MVVAARIPARMNVRRFGYALSGVISLPLMSSVLAIDKSIRRNSAIGCEAGCSGYTACKSHFLKHLRGFRDFYFRGDRLRHRQQRRDQSGPTGLMAGADAAT